VGHSGRIAAPWNRRGGGTTGPAAWGRATGLRVSVAYYQGMHNAPANPAVYRAGRQKARPDKDLGARRLGHPQLAFVRCWAEGLDLVAAWNRYLYVDGPGDARRARGELRRLLDELRGLARAHGRPDIAALLRRDPEAMGDPGPPLPTLEAFAATQPPDFYSQAELEDLYQAQVGRLDSRGAGRRRQRLRERLVLAVQWLERAGARAPLATDPLAAWLDERVAARLSAAGLRSVGDLVDRVRRKGFHWHRGVAGLGARGAARIVRWIVEHETSLGPLPRQARLPARRIDAAALTPAPCGGIVPLERWVAPAGCASAAAGDRGAIQAWLALRTPGSHTWRAYRKEAERLLLWVVLVRGKSLSSLDTADCAAYRAFLSAPGADWTGPRNAPRCSAGWRPFEGPLSPRSASTAVGIVRALFSWLVKTGHVTRNPWLDVSAPVSAPAAAPALHALEPSQGAALQAWLDSQAPSPALQRLRFVVCLGRQTGLRLSELAAARAGWLRQQTLVDGASAWCLQVPGTGGRWRAVPLPAPAVAALRAYLLSRGLSPDLHALPPGLPLIARLDGRLPLSAGRLYEVLVAAFQRCASWLAQTDPGAAEKIRDASTRWLRHTHGVQALAGGEPLQALRARLGHRRLASTARYAPLALRWRQGAPHIGTGG
jgi:site-specific recombinase XerD